MKKEKKNKKSINFKFNLLAIICISIFVIGIVEKTLQNDTYYTITLGKYILNNGIDMMEHFSWHQGLIYTYPHWLYDVFMYITYNTFGFVGIYGSSIVLGIILGISIYYVLSKTSKNNLISFFVALLVVYLGKHFITARAQLVTFILFIWTMYFIEMFLDTKKKRYAIGLILIPIAIANIHAAVFPFYFILFLPYIGEYIVSLIEDNIDLPTLLFLKSDKIEIKKLSNKKELTEKEIKKLEQLTKRVEVNEKRIEQKTELVKARKGKEYKIIINRRGNVKWLIIIMVICAFTGLLTPIGDTPYTYLIHTMQGNTTGNISEHLPMVLAQTSHAIIIISLYLILLAFTKSRVRLSDLFLNFGLITLAFMSRRQMSMVYFVGAIAFNNIVCNFIETYTKEEQVEEIKKVFVSWKGQLIAYTLVVLVTAGLLFSTRNDKIINENSYPVKACDYILENLDVNNIKIFNDYNYGSYLMYRGIPVFIDSRADVYDPKFNGLKDDIFQDYIKTNGLNKYYEDTFEHYGITHVISYANSKLALYLSHDYDYKELYKDKNFVIYERLSK